MYDLTGRRWLKNRRWPHFIFAIAAIGGLFAILITGCDRPKTKLQQARRKVQQQPQSPGAVATLGRQYYEAGHYNDAYRTLKTAVAYDQNNATLLHLWAKATLRLGNTAQGIRICRRAVQLQPDNATCHATLARAYALSNSEKQAILQFKKAMQYDASNALDTTVDFAYTCMASDKPKVALRLARQAANDHPNSPRAQYVYGDLLMQNHQLKKAITRFEKTLNRDGDYYLALMQLGLIFVTRDEQYQRVGNLARKAQEIVGSAPASAMIAWATYKKKRQQVGLRKLAEITRDNPDNHIVWSIMGMVLKDNEAPDKAAQVLKRARILPHPVPITRPQYQKIKHQTGDTLLTRRHLKLQLPHTFEATQLTAPTTG